MSVFNEGVEAPISTDQVIPFLQLLSYFPKTFFFFRQ